MTIDLEAVRAREEQATRGPWKIGVRWDEPDGAVFLPINSPSTNEDEPNQPDRVALIRYYPGGFQYPHHDARADAEFIANARQDVPALLAEVDRLRRVVAAVESITQSTDGDILDPDSEIPVGEVLRMLYDHTEAQS